MDDHLVELCSTRKRILQKHLLVISIPINKYEVLFLLSHAKKR